MMIRIEQEPGGYRKPKARTDGALLRHRRAVVFMGIIVVLISAMALVWSLMDHREARAQEAGKVAVQGHTAQVAAYQIEAPAYIKTAANAPQDTAQEYVPEETKAPASRGGDRAVSVTMECTAYTLRKEECGKSPDDPWYGITASGVPVKAWHTVAADKSLAFGTMLYIPYFKDKPNQGIFVVEDRGGAITEGCIDIYMESLDDALQFGRRDLEVYVMGE